MAKTLGVPIKILDNPEKKQILKYLKQQPLTTKRKFEILIKWAVKHKKKLDPADFQGVKSNDGE